MIEPALAKATNGAMAKRGSSDGLSPEEILEEVGSHVLRDGFRLVVDLRKSHGCRLADALSGREFLDFYGGHGSMMVGFNHPWFGRPAVKADLELSVKTKLANADIVSGPYARFVKAFSRVLGLPPLERYFFIEGGALAVENALKAAMDWKVRKNLAAGSGPITEKGGVASQPLTIATCSWRKVQTIVNC